MGDSIFSRWNLSDYFPGKGYVDGGIAGQTTSQILARMPDAISGNNVCTGEFNALQCQTITPPKTIVIFAGWNNLFQGTDPQQAIDDITAMVRMCVNAGVRPVVVTIYHFDPAFTGGSQFNAPADAIDHGIVDLTPVVSQVFVIDLEQVFANQSQYTADGVHPTAAGYARMQSVFQDSLNYVAP
ncbi:MAG TPA: GDSL-type esterase/lipase family protein [Candidatus Angelobacter sp.]|nr:GDSL-type esterase/lipase family protein [Candidatus Angelobacter sp.]